MSANEYETSHVMFLHNIINGGIVNTPEMAEKMAAVILEGHYGGEALQLQQPFLVTDLSDRWLVEGNKNRTIGDGEMGAARVEIIKETGQILDAHIPTTLNRNAGS